jgi:hypothetical protein
MSDELKERPMDFETERASQSEIDAAVAEITARLKAADAKEERIALLEAEELGFMKTSLEYKRRIALLEAAIRKHRESQPATYFHDKQLYAVLQEQGE